MHYISNRRSYHSEPCRTSQMAGVCNSAFRLTVKEFGAGMVCTEMVSDKGIVNKNEKTMNMLYIDPDEEPMSLQFFGGEKETLIDAAKFVDQKTTDNIIDINMGCPVLVEEPSPKEKIDVCMRHMDRLIRLKNEKVAIREMRKHASWY